MKQAGTCILRAVCWTVFYLGMLGWMLYQLLEDDPPEEGN